MINYQVSPSRVRLGCLLCNALKSSKWQSERVYLFLYFILLFIFLKVGWIIKIGNSKESKNRRIDSVFPETRREVMLMLRCVTERWRKIQCVLISHPVSRTLLYVKIEYDQLLELKPLDSGPYWYCPVAWMQNIPGWRYLVFIFCRQDVDDLAAIPACVVRIAWSRIIIRSLFWLAGSLQLWSRQVPSHLPSILIPRTNLGPFSVN
jgi:hypothetical protein